MTRDGQMLMVEYKAETPDSRVDPLHRMSEAEIMDEIPALGFRRHSVIDIIPSQHVFVFKKTAISGFPKGHKYHVSLYFTG